MYIRTITIHRFDMHTGLFYDNPTQLYAKRVEKNDDGAELNLPMIHVTELVILRQRREPK